MHVFRRNGTRAERERDDRQYSRLEAYAGSIIAAEVRAAMIVERTDAPTNFRFATLDAVKPRF
jgi:hypothetical protein